ncbi:MAG: hypothetical protein LBC99_10660 [Spirochaetota bacterium]|jgi:hypothetical protein|nr:hypothetical protein [Spirochaetota bacterium]
MLKQFWVEFCVILGLALIAFLGFQLPHWTILSAELESDALPLSCFLFINSYFAFILALSSFCTGSFLQYKLGYTALPHIVCFLISAAFVALFASYGSAAWQYRLQNADKRLALLEQQSLQRQAGERAVFIAPNMLLIALPGSAGEPEIPILAAKLDDDLYAGGALRVLDWSIEESVQMETNLAETLTNGLQPGKSIRGLIPKTTPSFISPEIDRAFADFIHWPIVDPREEKMAGLEGMLFLIGLSMLACGGGLLLNKRGLSLIQALASVFVFLLLIALPLSVFHSIWLSSDSGFTEQSVPWIRAAAALALGLPCFLLGLRRRRGMESEMER